MIDFLIAAAGVFVGFMFRSVLPDRPPADHFDVFPEVGEPPSNVVLHQDVA
jgi:hypothetical protein